MSRRLLLVALVAVAAASGALAYIDAGSAGSGAADALQGTTGTERESIKNHGVSSRADLTNAEAVIRAYKELNKDGEAANDLEANASFAALLVRFMVEAGKKLLGLRNDFVRAFTGASADTTLALNSEFVNNEESDAIATNRELGLEYWRTAKEKTVSEELRAAATLALDNLARGAPAEGTEREEATTGAEVDTSQINDLSNTQSAQDDSVPNGSGTQFVEQRASIGAGAWKDGDVFHVVVRAFIPGADTKAASGFASGLSGSKLEKPSFFSKSYGLPAGGGPNPGWGGYVVGIYETDEVFNSNHRDWSFDVADNAHSKVYTYVKLQRTKGVWTKTVSADCARTVHHCNTGLWPIWSAGQCCSKKASAPKNPVTKWSGGASSASFTVDVRVGNPCVPGSWLVGPIIQKFGIHVDFASNTFSYAGAKSGFPAHEICYGTVSTSLRCEQFGIKGRNVYDLMGPLRIVERVSRKF